MRLLNVLMTAGSEALEELTLIDVSQTLATMYAVTRFPSHTRMSVELTAIISDGSPLLQRYSYRYMTAAAATIFRYDNSIHHPELPHFPHHKHTGADERITPCPQPTARAIRNEIAAYLAD